MGKLELRGLRKAYPNFTLELDLSVEEGEFLTVIGPSGSGKSTLLSLISGLESPDSGQILLDGKDIVPLPPQKRSVGLVFQDYALFPSMSVEDNVSYALKVRHIPKKEGRQAAGDLLDFVSLPGYGKRKVTMSTTPTTSRAMQKETPLSVPKVIPAMPPSSWVTSHPFIRISSGPNATLAIPRLSFSTGFITQAPVSASSSEVFAPKLAAPVTVRARIIAARIVLPNLIWFHPSC